MRVLVLACLLPSLARAATPTFEADRADVPAARRAYEVLLRTCPTAARAVAVSSSVSVIPDGGSITLRQRFGWSAQLFVQMTLADGRNVLPEVLANTPSFRDAWFVLGGSPKPGVVPTTPAARVLCGLPAARSDGEDDDTLIAAPALALLRAWPSSRRQPAVHAPRAGCPDPNTAYRLGEGPPIPPGC